MRSLSNKNVARKGKFESDIDMSLSNSSIGAEAPAAAFGKTAFADFASARYKFGDGRKSCGRYVRRSGFLRCGIPFEITGI